MSGSANVLKRNVSSIVTLLIGLFVFVSIPSQIAIFDDGGMNPVTARTLPYLISSGIILFSLFIILSDIFGTSDEEENASEALPQEQTSYLRVFLAFAAIAIWIVVLPYLGYILSTILLVSTIMLIIGNCRWWQIAILAFVLSVPMHYLLAIALRVYLPSGSLFN